MRCFRIFYPVFAGPGSRVSTCRSGFMLRCFTSGIPVRFSCPVFSVRRSSSGLLSGISDQIPRRSFSARGNTSGVSCRFSRPEFAGGVSAGAFRPGFRASGVFVVANSGATGLVNVPICRPYRHLYRFVRFCCRNSGHVPDGYSAHSLAECIRPAAAERMPSRRPTS